MYGTWSFRKHVMKFIKWIPHFSLSHEPPFAPVWISFHHLPINFFLKGPLLSLTSLIGKPLKIVAVTQTISCPSVARICLEADLIKDLPKHLWIRQGDSGFWQSVSYENLLPYCEDCTRVDHSFGECNTITQPTFTFPQQKIWQPNPWTRNLVLHLKNLKNRYCMLLSQIIPVLLVSLILKRQQFTLMFNPL